MTPKFFLISGSLLGFLSVALGAFAAHSLKARLDTYSLGIFETAVDYQFFHAFALIAVGLASQTFGKEFQASASGWCFLLGILIFSGSLYALALSGIKILGAITPIGGLLFLAGWAILAFRFWKINV